MAGPLVPKSGGEGFAGHKLDASPPLAGGPIFAPKSDFSDLGGIGCRTRQKPSSMGEARTRIRGGGTPREFMRQRGYPSPKIAAASRQRFVGPPARGGLAVRCCASDFSIRVSAIFA